MSESSVHLTHTQQLTHGHTQIHTDTLSNVLALKTEHAGHLGKAP